MLACKLKWANQNMRTEVIGGSAHDEFETLKLLLSSIEDCLIVLSIHHKLPRGVIRPMRYGPYYIKPRAREFWPFFQRHVMREDAGNSNDFSDSVQVLFSIFFHCYMKLED